MTFLLLFNMPQSLVEHLFCHVGMKTQLSRFSLVRQQSSLPCHIRLLSTKVQAKSREGEDTLISQLPYSFLDKVPGMGYMAILNEVAAKIQKGLPLQRYHFCHFMRQIDNQKIVNSAEAKTWLDSTGTTCLAFSDTKRAEFTRWMWNKIQEIGDSAVQEDVNLFNRYMKVLLDNKSPLTPSEIAAEMKAKQFTPNQITYLMVIASACEQGDMTEAREQLAKMKNQGFLVSTHLYNSLMRGYCQAGYVEKAEEMLNSMSSLNLEANDMTYANLLLAYAERGDVTKIKRILAEMDEKGYALITNKALEMVTVLENGDFVLEAERVFEMIKNKIREPSLIILSTALKALLENGHTDLALKVLVSLGKTGRVLCDIALLCKLPVDELVKLVKRCKELKMGELADGYIAREAGNLAMFDTAVELYKRTDKAYTPRVGDLFPVIDYYCHHGTLDDLLKLQPLIEKMTTWDIVTAMELIYPAMKKLGKTCEEVVQILRDHNTLDEGEFNTIVVRTLLCRESLPLAKAEVEKMRTVEHILLSPVCNTALERNFLKKPEDWKQVLEFVVEVQKKRKFSHNCFGVFGAIKSKFSEVDLSLEPVVDFMIEHDLKWPSLDVPGVPVEKLKQVHKRHTEAKNYSPELEQQYPDNTHVLRHHLRKAANALDKRTVDGICRLTRLQRDTFVDIPCVLALIGMYIRLGDAENALLNIKQIQDKIPNFRFPPQYGLALADILFKEKRYEGTVLSHTREMVNLLIDAFDILSKTPRKIKDDSIMNETDYELYVNSLQSLRSGTEDPELNNRLMEILVENHHINKKTRTSEVQPKTFDSLEAINQKLASEEEIQRLTMDDVQKIFEYFIKHDNKEDLQKASDLFSKHKDSERVLYRLCAAFAVEGKLLQARKVLQQPGMQVNKEELKDICAHFMKERINIKCVENFQNVLKDTGYRFDPHREVLFTIFRKTALNDMAKGLEFLETGFIFHGEESPRRAYSYLANIYKSAGKAVPFKIPFDMVNYSTQQKRQTRKIPIMNAATDSESQGSKQTAPKRETKKKPENLSKETGESVKNSAVIEAPVSDVIEKSEEVQAVLEQADPAVEITEIKESTKEVLNPVGEDIKDVNAQTDTAEEISVK